MSTDAGSTFPDDASLLPEGIAQLNRSSLSRRKFLAAASGAGFAAVAFSLGIREGYAFGAGPSGASTLGSGTIPEQIHMTWGADPSTEVTISWASPSLQTQPQVAINGGSPIAATHVTYTDGLSGEVVHCYHVPLTGLTPDTTYSYVISDPADNAVTFTSTFTTTSQGRFAFAFTSFGDLATPGAGATYTMADNSTIESTGYSESQWNAYNAVGEIELMAANPVAAGLPAGSMPPLFHLLNGDLAYGDKDTITSGGAVTTAGGAQPAPEVWRDFALNMQRSAANRPWMPCVGNHEVELDNANHGMASYMTRFMLPGNGTSFPGSFYSFQVGSVLFISLDANDVCYQGAGAYNVGAAQATDSNGNTIYKTAYQYNLNYTGTFTQNADLTLSPGGATPNAQTVWLKAQLQAARSSTDIDWIIVQMHQCACSSTNDNGCDAGIRRAWVPLFDAYEVDIVVNGHDHDYERTWPVRGFTNGLGTGIWPGTALVAQAAGFVNQASSPVNVTVPSNETGPVNTFTPNVVTTTPTANTQDGLAFDTSQGTVYLTLGGGGTNKLDNTYGGPKNIADTAGVTTFTQVRTGGKPTPDSYEPANWSAVRDATPANDGTDTSGAYPYGVAYFAVDPGELDGYTTITVTYVHEAQQNYSAQNTPGPAYTQFDQFVVARARSDANPPGETPEFAMPALAVGGAALAGGALLVQQHRRSARLAHTGQDYDSSYHAGVPNN